MALEFFDSCATYNNNNGMGLLWSGLGGVPAGGAFGALTIYVNAGTAYGRFSGEYGVNLSTSNGAVAAAAWYSNLTNQATRFAALSLNPNSYGSPNGLPIMGFCDTNTSQVYIKINAAGKIEIWRGNGTLLNTSATALTPGVWCRIEAECTVNSSTGYVEVRVNGVTAVTYSGNTQNSGNAYSNVVYFATGSTGNANMTDFLIYNNTGAAPNAFLGDKRIYSRFPSGNGSTQNYTQNIAAWPSSTAVAIGTTILDSNSNVQRVTSVSGTGTTGSSHPTWATGLGATTTDNAGANQVVWTNLGTQSAYELVNETPFDGDYSYLSDATLGDVELFTFPPIPTSATGIVAVGTVFTSRKDDAATRSLRGYALSGSSTADTGTDLAQSTSYATYEGALIVDPNTGVTWTPSGVNASQFGTKTTA